MMRRAFSVTVAISMALILSTPTAISAPKIGATCSKLGASTTISGQYLECKKSGAKKVWTKAARPIPSPTAVSGVEILMTKLEETVLNQTLAYPVSGSAQVSSAIVTLLSGEETGWHRHDAPLYGYILSGVLQVSYDGGVVKTYKTGDALLEAIGTYHNGQNLGTKPVRILVVNIGANGVENTVKKL
jgi:quercetin dioxygenase-like cupin family protein